MARMVSEKLEIFGRLFSIRVGWSSAEAICTFRKLLSCSTSALRKMFRMCRDTPDWSTSKRSLIWACEGQTVSRSRSMGKAHLNAGTGVHHDFLTRALR